ncbi:MAG: adenosine deaminase [Deltaproteobacteria bacterium]|nr:adenosine deaminase [Deltaproteobacteria bacterium]
MSLNAPRAAVAPRRNSHPPAGPTVTRELLLAMPKTDLHCHLDGSLRVTSMLEMARDQGVTLPSDDPDGLAKALHSGQVCKSLGDYLQAFAITLSVLQTDESLERVAFELAEDCHRENIRYLEVRFAPSLHTDAGLRVTAVVESVLAGLRRAEKQYGIRSGVIVCALRHESPSETFRMAELAVAYKNKGVVGFDLAGGEAGNPAKNHAEAFALILNNNLNCTVHAGEAYGPESIQQAIHYCGAHRIGHGVRLVENGDLLNYVNDHRVPLEICISSNVQTNSVRDFKTHPLRFFFDYGVRCTINTDNRLITKTTVTEELWLAHQHCGFDMDDLKVLIVQGFKSAFLPFREKSELLRQVNAEIASITGTPPRGPGELMRPTVSMPPPSGA